MDAPERTASLWQGSRDGSRMPVGCGMSVCPVTLADVRDVVWQWTVKGACLSVLDPEASVVSVASSSLPKHSLNSPFQLRE